MVRFGGAFSYGGHGGVGVASAKRCGLGKRGAEDHVLSLGRVFVGYHWLHIVSGYALSLGTVLSGQSPVQRLKWLRRHRPEKKRRVGS